MMTNIRFFSLIASTISALTLFFIKFLIFHVDLDSCLVFNKQFLAVHITNSYRSCTCMCTASTSVDFRDLFLLYFEIHLLTLKNKWSSLNRRKMFESCKLQRLLNFISIQLLHYGQSLVPLQSKVLRMPRVNVGYLTLRFLVLAYHSVCFLKITEEIFGLGFPQFSDQQAPFKQGMMSFKLSVVLSPSTGKEEIYTRV